MQKTVKGKKCFKLFLPKIVTDPQVKSDKRHEGEQTLETYSAEYAQALKDTTMAHWIGIFNDTLC